MQIVDHFLYKGGAQVEYVQSPSCGGELAPFIIVMHYTAAPSPESAVMWLSNPRAQASAHLVIGRAGEIYQLVPFNVMAWHAGASRHGLLTSLNQYSIGIEMDNAGMLRRGQDGWVSWFGKLYGKSGDVVVARHWKHDYEAGWHVYPTAQLESVVNVVRLLVETYGIREILGHDEISDEKVDPGPAFPMEWLRSEALQS